MEIVQQVESVVLLDAQVFTHQHNSSMLFYARCLLYVFTVLVYSLTRSLARSISVSLSNSVSFALAYQYVCLPLFLFSFDSPEAAHGFATERPIPYAYMYDFVFQWCRAQVKKRYVSLNALNKTMRQL